MAKEKREKAEVTLGNLTAAWRSVWYWLIVRNVKLTGMVIFIVGLLVVLTTGAYLVWFLRAKPVAPEMKTAERGLNTAIIDRLELWIEQVDGQRREGIVLPSQPLFVADDLKLVPEEAQP